MACGSARAADQALPPVAPPLSWTGFYAGLNAGYGWGSSSSFNLTGLNGAGSALLNPALPPGLIVTAAGTGSSHARGAFAGFQLGYNWQIARNWLIGIEADIQHSSIRARTQRFNTTTVPGFENFMATVAGRNLEWFGTLRGRVGVLATDNLLLFATGGLAYGRDKASVVLGLPGGGFIGFGGTPDATTFGCATPVCLSGSGSRTSTGWTAGGGIEYALSNTWSIKAEYLHIDLDLGQTFVMRVVPPATGNALMSASVSDYSIDIVRVGMNYKFAPR
jgi:outer membrane immunogenic protein